MRAPPSSCADLAQRLREPAPRRRRQRAESGPETLIERSAYLPQTAARGWREQARGGLRAGARRRPAHRRRLRREVERLVAAVAPRATCLSSGTLPAHPVTREEASRSVQLAVGEGAAGADLADGRGAPEAPRPLPAEADAGARAAQAYGLAAARRPRYDAANGSLLVPGFIPFEAQRTEVAHEVAHAMADQRFGFRKLLEIRAPTGPRASTATPRRARLALVEGDAMLTGLELVDPRESFLGAHELDPLGRRRAPRRRGGSPIGSASSVVHARRRSAVRGPGARPPPLERRRRAVDRARPPPASRSCTRRNTTPARRRSPSTRRLCPRWPGSGALPASDVLGELVVRTWLASAVSPEIAWRAAAGWGGDRAGLYARRRRRTPTEARRRRARPRARPPGATTRARRSPGSPCGTMPAEADDFARAARQVLVRMSSAASGTPAGDDDGDRDGPRFAPRHVRAGPARGRRGAAARRPRAGARHAGGDAGGRPPAR